MIIQVNTDSNVDGNSELTQQVTTALETSLERFSAHVTRVEVHLRDENSDKKSGTADMRCLLEARLSGLPPLAVSHHAQTMDRAIDGAVDKLVSSIASTVGKLNSQLRGTPPAEGVEAAE